MTTRNFAAMLDQGLRHYNNALAIGDKARINYGNLMESEPLYTALLAAFPESELVSDSPLIWISLRLAPWAIYFHFDHNKKTITDPIADKVVQFRDTAEHFHDEMFRARGEADYWQSRLDENQPLEPWLAKMLPRTDEKRTRCRDYYKKMMAQDVESVDHYEKLWLKNLHSADVLEAKAKEIRQKMLDILPGWAFE